MRGKWSRGGKRHTYIRAGDMKETLISTKKTKKKGQAGEGLTKKIKKRWGHTVIVMARRFVLPVVVGGD